MASLFRQQELNQYKTYLLLVFFFVLFIAFGWVVSWYLESQFIFWLAIFIALAVNITAYWNSDKIAVRMTGARPVTRKEFFDCWNSLENLSISSGMEMPKLYVIEDTAPNAFATGRNTKNSLIAVTTGLLQILDKNELEGVLAHELSHIQNRDTLIMTITVVLIATVSIILDFAFRAMFFGGGDNKGKGVMGLILLLVVAIAVPVILSILKFSISRKREYVADATAGVLTRYPEGLASALEKIRDHGVSMKRANTATAHLFISDPFTQKKKNFYSSIHRIFATHPPIEKRIAALRGSI